MSKTAQTVDAVFTAVAAVFLWVLSTFLGLMMLPDNPVNAFVYVVFGVVSACGLIGLHLIQVTRHP